MGAAATALVRFEFGGCVGERLLGNWEVGETVCLYGVAPCGSPSESGNFELRKFLVWILHPQRYMH